MSLAGAAGKKVRAPGEARMTGDFAAGPLGFFGGLGPGSRIAGYVIEEEIGAGGMAVVFRARDEVLRRYAAVKVITPVMAGDEEFRARFVRESRAVAAVDSAHIIPVYAAGEAKGLLYIATRFVTGGDLATQLRRAGGRLPPERVASLILQVGSALDAAHAIGLVHRDVKPGNILVDLAPGRPEHAYLSDFGLSKATASSTVLTASGQFLGTPDYCAPEQVRSSHVDGRADQYALGCVAFALLTGTPPFRRPETITTLLAHLQDPVPVVTWLVPQLPVGVDDVIARVLAKSPAERYGSCGEFAEALRDALVSVQPAVRTGQTEPSGDAALLSTGYPVRPLAARLDPPQAQQRLNAYPPPPGTQPSPTAGKAQPPSVRESNSTPAALHPSGTATGLENRAYASTIGAVGAHRSDAVPPGPSERRQLRRPGRKTALIGGTATAVLAAAGIITVLRLPHSQGQASPDAPPPPTTSSPLPSSAVRSSRTTGTSAAGTLRPVSDESFNPYGQPPGNTEDGVTASYAIDNSLATAWATSYYFNTPYFDGLKPGTGLLIDMGKPVTLSSATVTFGSIPGTNVRIEVGNSDSQSTSNLTAFVPVAEKTDASGTTVFQVSRKATGRYVLIWLTKLPLDKVKPAGDTLSNPVYQGFIYNVALKGIS